MNKDRRKFLQAGAATIPAAFLIKNFPVTASSVPSEGALVQTHNFLIQPEQFLRMNEVFEVVSATPWAIAHEDLDLLPYINGSQRLDLNNLEGKEKSNFITPERLSSFSLQGEIPVMDIAGDISLARSNNQPIDISLSFFDKLTGQTNPLAPVYHNSKGLSVAAKNSSQLMALNPSPKALNVRIPISVPFTNYLLQFRGPDTGHSMAPCAPEPRSHYHIEVQQKTNRGNKYLANFHIGIWRSGRQICFAIANSEGRPTCFKRCTPTWTDIKNGVQQALVGIGISLAIAAAIAAVAATVMYGSLVLLAV